MPNSTGHSDALILFDGICKLCNGFVNFIIRIDKKGKFKFLPLQSPATKKFLEQVGLSESLSRNPNTVILIEGKKGFVKSDAVLRIAGQLPFPWRAIAYFSFAPKRIRNGLYDFVASKRYAWFGKKDQCMVPKPEVLDRFL